MGIHGFIQLGSLGIVIYIVFGIEWIPFPIVLIEIKGCPDFNLYDYIPFCGFMKKMLKPPPIFIFPLIQIIMPIFTLLERPNITAVPAGHGVADIIASC